MASNTSTKVDSTATLKPLYDTANALTKIKSSLLPFLQILDYHHNQNGINSGSRANDDKYNIHQIAEAHAAVALSIGTLRFMANRLNGRRCCKGKNDDDDDDDSGDERGDKKKDPLRMELEKMRKTLMELKKLQKNNSSVNDDGDRLKRKKGGVVDSGIRMEGKIPGEIIAKAKKRKFDTKDS